MRNINYAYFSRPRLRLCRLATRECRNQQRVNQCPVNHRVQLGTEWHSCLGPVPCSKTARPTTGTPEAEWQPGRNTNEVYLIYTEFCILNPGVCFTVSFELLWMQVGYIWNISLEWCFWVIDSKDPTR